MLGRRGAIWWCPRGCGKTISRSGTIKCCYTCNECNSKWIGRRQLEVAQNAVH